MLYHDTINEHFYKCAKGKGGILKMKWSGKKLISLILACLLMVPGNLMQAMAAEVNEVRTILPNETTGETNYFTYTAYAGKSWVPSEAEAYIDLGSFSDRAEECYYEVTFTGNAIEVFANKSHNHGKVKYSVDDGEETLVDLYNATRTSPQSVYKAGNLGEGEHVLRAVTQKERTGSAIVNQVAYAKVTHAPYVATDFTLSEESLVMTAGQSGTVSCTFVPSYASLDDLSYESSDAGVASVSPDGRITAQKKGTAVITVSSERAGIAKTIEVQVKDAVLDLGGTVVDNNTQYTQARYDEVSIKNRRTMELTAWSNDKAVSELVLFSRGGKLENVTITASDLTDGEQKISSGHVTATYIKSTKAYTGGYPGGGVVPPATESNRADSADILYQTEPIDIPFNSLQPVWVEFEIPAGTKAGTYTGTLSATADGIEEPVVFQCQIRVQGAELPESFGSTFDIELWQYPYTSAEYYDVEPFSPEHLEIMKSSMLKYKEIGGHAITASIVEEAWSGQTYSENEVHYPSMVKWTKTGDSFTYDYTDFDAWVEFNKSLGIGDKIVLYSIAPWHNSFTYWENGKLTYERFTPGSERYSRVWKDFLEDLVAHLMEKGWFEESYIGIDERGFTSAAFDLIESVKNIHAECLKTAGAMDSFVEKKDLAMRVTDLNVGDTAAAAHASEFAQLLQEREEKGLRTTLYSCTGHRPGNFSLSAPVESYWSIINAGKMGTAGFLRWAYDAWVEDPLRDTTHRLFEPGDCFLIFPDEKDADNPTSKSSVRLERMAEGVRDVNKLKLMEEEMPVLKADIQELYSRITTTARSSSAFLSDAQVASLSEEMDAFKQGVAELTEEYIRIRESGYGQIEESARVSYYSFDETDDLVIKDAWGGRDAVNQGAALVKGKTGRALEISEDGQCAVPEGDAAIQENWTVSCWVKAEATADRSSVLMSRDGNYSFDVRLAADRTRCGVHVGTGSGDVLTYPYTFPANTWVYMTWTQDEESGLSLYINGELIQTNGWTAENTFLCPADLIGGTGFRGKIDELSIYNRVLTRHEIMGCLLAAGTDTEDELYIKNRLPVYQLDASCLTDIDKDEGGERQYLGQPDMIMLDDNQTLITAYPVGHGCGPIVMKVSRDAGKTWEEKTDLPESWEGSLETPTLYKLNMTDGTTKLMLITGRPNWNGNLTGGWSTSVSEDNGETWTEYETFHQTLNGQKNWTIVAMASLIQLKDENGNAIDKWMGVYHNYNYVNYKTYLTFDEQGNQHWSEPEPLLEKYRGIESTYQMCEIGMFRSPDGKRIVGLARSQSHNNPATLIYSDDEGDTWSKPMDLPGSLAGERHKAAYDPVSGRMLITFREICYDQNGNNQFDGYSDWMAGDWVAWVGTYDDLINQREGQYRILIAEDWANNAKSGDTGYAGVTVQPDGTFILDSYGHWDKEFSQSWGGGVTTDLCYIRQAKFRLADIDKQAGITPDTEKLKDKIAGASEMVNSGYTKESWETFRKALEEAKELMEKPYKVQEEVDAALEALDQAIQGLKKQGIVTPPVIVKKPAVPAMTSVSSASYNSLKITWGKEEDASKYELYRAESIHGSYQKIFETRSADTVSYIDKGLVTGRTYYYKVRSAVGGSTWDYSDFSEIRYAKPALAKAKISSVKNLPGRKLKIKWKKVSGADGYEISRAVKKKGNYKKIKSVKKGKTVQYTDTKRKKNQTCYYRVRAYRMVGKKKVYGPYSSIKSCKVKK